MTCPACGSTMRDDARVCLSCGEVVRAKVAPAERLQAVTAGVPQWIAFDGSKQADSVSYPASRIQRIVAAFIDACVLAIPLILIGLVTGQSTATLDSSRHLSVNWLWIGVTCGIQAGYFIGFAASSWQGTPGKRFMGLRIVTLEQEPISLPQSIGRWACQQVIFAIVIPLAMMVALFGIVAVPIAILVLCGDGRSPWDRMAGTMVVG